jgi:tRNA A-37 threonylcarbamoyl transferase component Bud32
MDTEEIRLEGRRLAGRYLLEAEIASGGMGTVWRARDEVLGRPVAVKVLHERLARDPDLLDRFRREAVAAARLSHPAVVRVFDTGIDDGVCYIVMELFEGRTLESVLVEEGPLAPADAARIVRNVLLGLAHAHREGVVHRDVKPSNILIHRNFVKVTDFGIAKAAFAGDDLTTTGNLLGTARYLAPEQVTGEGVDHRADLYAAGIVLYEALTGRAPFEGDTHIATATMRLTKDPVPPGAMRSGIPRGLDAVVMGALAREPGRRFQSAEEMGAALDRAIPGDGRPAAFPQPEPRPEPEPRPSSIRSWFVIPLVVLLLAALAVGGVWLLGRLLEEGGGEPGPGEGARPEALEVAAAASYDPPPGDGSEHDEDLAAATDGDRATSWTTEGYTTPDLGGRKSGVGLVLDLGAPQEVGGLRLRTDTPGFSFSLFASETPDEFDLEAPIASAEGETSFTAEDGTSFDVGPVETRYVLVWITALVDADNYRAHVNEIDLFAPGE